MRIVRTAVRSLFVAVGLTLALATPVMAAPCKDQAACVAACDAGDPAACAVASYSPFESLAQRKVPATKKKVTRCDDAPTTCNLYAAHLWAGAGVRANRALATALWADHCADDDFIACFVHAKAVVATDPATAASEYRQVCQERGYAPACKAAGALWTRVQVTSGAAFTVELPAILVAQKPGRWFVAFAGSAGGFSHLEIDIVNGAPRCKGPSAAQAARLDDKHDERRARSTPEGSAEVNDVLAAGWVDRACKSVTLVR